MSEPASSSSSADTNPDNTIKFLVASDIHLGYDEKNPIRGEDSFLAFEEVLQHAVENDVDAILLGGDLFHIANPSTNTLNRCLRLLKTYTLGDKPIRLEFLTDQNQELIASLSSTMNYEDPNINVAIPVYSIHGNHDDATGFGHISAMELLSTNGYVNYFGKWNDLNKIVINPILLRKGETKLALYGLNYIADARLCRLLEERKVFFQKPEEQGWFHVLVLHQNRADRGPKNYLPEHALPKFLDLVIWGHEHDCRIRPEENPHGKFYVSQPGSTVATSLSEGESIEKCCALLRIHKGMFCMDPIRLTTVRPFVFESVELDSLSDQLDLEVGDAQEKVMDFAAERVEELIQRAKAKLTGNERQPKIPLIRLRLVTTHVEYQFNRIRFGQRYMGKVANPLDMILFQKKVVRVKDESVKLDSKAFSAAYIHQRQQNANRPEDIVYRYFQEADEANKLTVLCPRAMMELDRRMVFHEDDDAADKILKFYEDKALEFLVSQVHLTDEGFDEVWANYADKIPSLYDDISAVLGSRAQKPADPMQRIHPTAAHPSDGETSAKKPASETARAKAAPRASAARGRAAAKKTASEAVKTTVAVSGIRSQASIASMFSQQSSNSSVTTVASRTSARKPAAKRGRPMVYDSDEDD
ncbi:double-strand break repair protein MRE11 [Anopheles cruzii]|uniref:double-strand break repair protein MRE11 n=1 Tax=Anopheles cruzii TaxID=68878 RepID=UPI0022EC2419|nr:double-strand break repair protein MRE11 [Anopheles cruzii]